MAGTIRKTTQFLRKDPVIDVLGGVWLVTLTFGLLHLPAFLA